MSKRILWTLGGALFGAVLSWAVGNTAIGIVICAAIGAIAGVVGENLQRRRKQDTLTS